eukprot:gene13891-15339_t
MAGMVSVFIATIAVCSLQMLTGPPNWYKTYATCGKKRQSPIELTPENSEFTSTFKNFVFNGYGTTSSSNFFLFNNGHTVQMTVTDPGNMTVNAFGQTFKPWQIHFHWGKTDSDGSEHRIRTAFHHPAEMHFVHVNTKYRDTAAALENYDGLLVFGTIIEIDKTDKNNTMLHKLVKHFSQVTYDKQNLSIPAFPLSETFAVKTSEYYHYNGSLTTPGCNEAVLWVVFKEHITMSKAQMSDFRKLQHNHGHMPANQTVYLSNNFRPLQLRNDRKIYKTFHSSAFNVVPSMAAILFSALLAAIAY